MQPGDTNWPGFQPLGCGSICTQGFALGWYRGAPLALEAIRQVWIFGGVTTSGFSQTDPLPKAPFILQNRPGFQPLGCGSICTQGFALGWYRSAPLALEPSAGCGFLGSVTTSAFSQTDPLPVLPHSTTLRVRMTSSLCRLSYETGLDCLRERERIQFEGGCLYREGCSVCAAGAGASA